MEHDALGEENAPILVYATFPDRDTALRIADELVGGKLAACVNVLGEITSIYNWEGSRQAETEVSAIIKTRNGLAHAVIDRVSALHPYENPAILVLPVSGGAKAFIAWIASETQMAE
ncbi:MAG: divalent-cation tolerance protein CutA [Hyphomicrobiaceae bacterium]|nr:divalent-cation tolerance protein CutA [Hyphomicrobiaceae bacterium]